MHFIQSFPHNEKLTHEKAHEIARELAADRFKGFEVLIATHRDKAHIHTHIIVNSVSHVDGLKFRQSKAGLQGIKNWSDKANTFEYYAAATNMHQLTGDFYTVGMILGHSLKGMGISLGISTNLEAVTAQYIDVRLDRKRIVLETYHNILHPRSVENSQESLQVSIT